MSQLAVVVEDVDPEERLWGHTCLRVLRTILGFYRCDRLRYVIIVLPASPRPPVILSRVTCVFATSSVAFSLVCIGEGRACCPVGKLKDVLTPYRIPPLTQ